MSSEKTRTTVLCTFATFENLRRTKLGPGKTVSDRNGACIRFEKGKLLVRDCSFLDNQNGIHGGYRGHLIKSRAKVSDIRYNLIHDGPGGEASHEINLPNGGIATLVGNIVGQSDKTQNPVVISYGEEGNTWPENRLTLVHNTLDFSLPKSSPLRWLPGALQTSP